MQLKKSKLLLIICLLSWATAIYFIPATPPQKTNLAIQETNNPQADSKQLLKAKSIISKAFNQKVGKLNTFEIPVTITGYSARTEECDSTPWVTADGTLSRVGVLAVSRDLLTDVGLRMGQRVLLADYGVFEIRDKMNKRFTNRVDILFAHPVAALKFGVKKGTLTWL